MAEYKVVNRSDLYDSGSDSESNSISHSGLNPSQKFILPEVHFDIVEVDLDEQNDLNHKEEKSEVEPNELEILGNDDQEAGEYEFPLFSMSSRTAGSLESQDSNNRGRGKVQVMKVNLRDPSPEEIRNERPTQYYFAIYSELQRAQFESVAVTPEDIEYQGRLLTATGENEQTKCINLNEYNKKIELEIEKKKHKCRRPGKKKRLNKIACRESKQQREKELKKILKEEKAKLMKKKYHKRGGKKHLKKGPSISQSSQPKYRTE